MVADGVEVSAMRESVWASVVDAELHQLRFEQGRCGGDGARKELAAEKFFATGLRGYTRIETHHGDTEARRKPSGLFSRSFSQLS